jgi:hypothetical protein
LVRGGILDGAASRSADPQGTPVNWEAIDDYTLSGPNWD